MSLLTIRNAVPGDEVDVAKVQMCSWAQTYHGVLPDNLLHPWDGRQLAGIWRKRLVDPVSRALSYVAEEDGSRIVGFGICNEKRGRALPTTGEIALLYVLESYQGLGLGRRLLRAMASALRSNGFRSTGAWVLADNEPAIGFYRNLGGIQTVERYGQFAGYRTHELGFVWSSALLAQSGTLKGVSVDTES